MEESRLVRMVADKLRIDGGMGDGMNMRCLKRKYELGSDARSVRNQNGRRVKDYIGGQ